MISNVWMSKSGILEYSECHTKKDVLTDNIFTFDILLSKRTAVMIPNRYA
jgi:hypothetical protein